ncbi:MAG TPA: hypothetical protein PLP84_04390 [Acholeplasmataceae bacterium]|nr:hypothetical protein [Acholeplasmataceae bacterium]
MKRLLSILLLILLLPFLASCEKKEMKEIAAQEVNTMLVDAKTKTNDVDVISLEAPIKVKTHNISVTSKGRSETRYSMEGTVKLVLDSKNFEGHLNMDVDYTSEIIDKGITTSGSALVNLYLDNVYVYLDVNFETGGIKTTLNNKIKHNISANQLNLAIDEFIAELDFTDILDPESEFKMYKLGKKYEFVTEVNLAEAANNPENNQLGGLSNLTYTDDSVIKLKILFGEAFEALECEIKANSTKTENIFDIEITNNVEVEANIKLNLKAKAKKIDFNKLKDFTEIEMAQLAELLGGLAEGFGGLGNFGELIPFPSDQ